MRISELLGLVWDDADLERGVIQVRAQLSRAHTDVAAQRVAPKTRAAVREIALVPQLAELLEDVPLVVELCDGGPGVTVRW